MTEPYWTTHSITCTPDCEGDWECGGCQCHPDNHSWGCHERCHDPECGCGCHAPELPLDTDKEEP